MLAAQPMNIAPRDGTTILVYDTRDNASYEAFWYVESENVLNRDRTPIGVWMLVGGGWFSLEDEEFLTWKHRSVQ